MAAWAVVVGACRMWVRPEAAWGPEVCFALERVRLSVRCARGVDVGSASPWAGRVRGALEGRIRALVSLRLGESRRTTAGSCLFGAVWPGGVVRCGTPKGPTT